MFKLTFVTAVVIISTNTGLALPGSGTQEDPYQIESLADFDEFAADPNYWDDYTRLETDVNLAGRTYSTAVIAPDTDNSRSGFNGATFTGVFDGNDHKITNLTIDDAGAGNDYLGLFGANDGGELKNMGIESCCVSGNSWVGGLVGFNRGSISNCYSTGDFSGGNYVGGLLGKNESGAISHCHSTGSVTGHGYVAGLVGGNYGTVSSCYSNGDVGGGYDLGGLVGANRGSVSRCFWDIDTQTHGVTDSIGDNDGIVTNVAGPPTAQMQTEFTFTSAGWDFLEIWNIAENQTYPYLRQYWSGDLNMDGRADLLDFAIFAGHWLDEAGQ